MCKGLVSCLYLLRVSYLRAMTKQCNKKLLNLSRPKDLPIEIQEIIKDLIAYALKVYPNLSKGIIMAALFDLFISCQYYHGLANKGWTYCPQLPNLMFYTYTNVCPRCLGKHKFVFSKANKPESGQIGMATTEILCEMLVAYFGLMGKDVEIYKASEPIDVIIYDAKSELMIISEVKAAPLLTIPLSLPCDNITEEVDGQLISLDHTLCDNPFIRQSALSMFSQKQHLWKNMRFN